jgi:hypothetical protein
MRRISLLLLLSGLVLLAQTGAKNGEWRSYGGDVASTLPHVLRLGGFAALMFAIALLLFQKPAR